MLRFGAPRANALTIFSSKKSPDKVVRLRIRQRHLELRKAPINFIKISYLIYGLNHESTKDENTKKKGAKHGGANVWSSDFVFSFFALS